MGGKTNDGYDGYGPSFDIGERVGDRVGDRATLAVVHIDDDTVELEQLRALASDAGWVEDANGWQFSDPYRDKCRQLDEAIQECQDLKRERAEGAAAALLSAAGMATEVATVEALRKHVERLQTANARLIDEKWEAVIPAEVKRVVEAALAQFSCGCLDDECESICVWTMRIGDAVADLTPEQLIALGGKS